MSHTLPNWEADSADSWIILSSPNIGAWSLWVAWGAVSGPKTKFLPSSADIWLSQLIVDAFSSGTRVGKAAESFREGSLLEENLSVVTLRAVGVLESKPTLFSLFSPKEDKDKALGEGFLEAEEAKILLEKRLAIQRV